MQVGTDSYVTLQEAEDYIAKHYRSNNPGRKRWAELEDADKEILLTEACSEIDLLPFIGRKTLPDQLLAFPRLPMQYGSADGAPAQVKAAQIEFALWLSDDDKQGEMSQREALRAQGVESFSIGDLSESYAGGGVKSAPLLCPKAAALLSPYLSGGYATC